MTDLPEPIEYDPIGFNDINNMISTVNQLLAYLREREGK
jgi:hypothetical protein